MKPELRQLERYLHDALGIEVAAAHSPGANRLPHFLRERYTFAQVKLLGTTCLLVIDANHAEESPAAIRKHLELLRTKQEGEAVYVRPQVTAYNRKRLIEQKVPFIVPGNQMYLPMLAVDLREHFRRTRSALPAFRPATQALVIHALLNDLNDELIPLEMARRLEYTPMTMTRAFDELEAANLGVMTVRGRERCLRFPDTRQEIWAKAQPFLRSPVNKRLFVLQGAQLAGIRAGLTALAHYSMLSAPAYDTVAVTGEQWKKFHDRRKTIQVPAADPDGLEVQVWSYPPALFAQKHIADPLSLYLSLKDDTDERTQGSLDEMMRNLGW
jgi:DNA-binding MarR family transcriptional regulator